MSTTAIGKRLEPTDLTFIERIPDWTTHQDTRTAEPAYS